MLRQARRGDDGAHLVRAEGRERPRQADQLDLHDVAFGRARFADADEAARRHARPDGEALGRDHREPDHLELQGRSDRARVLQLDPRRPQGPRRHRAEDREFRLSDAPSRRRRAGFDHHDGGLRLEGRHQNARDHRRGAGRRLAGDAHSRTHDGRGSEGSRGQDHRRRRRDDPGVAHRPRSTRPASRK